MGSNDNHGAARPLGNLLRGRRTVQAEVAVADLDRLIAGLVACRDTIAESGAKRWTQGCRWQDEDNLYFEIPIPSDSPKSADICLSAGKAFLRLDR